jgi:hypothetical protein
MAKNKTSIWTVGNIWLLIFFPPLWLLMLFTGDLRKDEERRQNKRHAKAVRHWDGYWNL